MPRLTNRTNLRPGPAPDAPPWRWLDPRTLQRWLNVSDQSLCNYRHRGTGPDWRLDATGHVWYQLAAVAYWIEGEGSPSPDSRIVRYLQANETALAHALWTLPAPLRDQSLRALARAATLAPGQVEGLCRAIDKATPSVPGRKPKMPFVTPRTTIGYPEDHHHAPAP